ncbi:MAG: hypothetical protein AB1542_13730 [Pseudomonadota bacterium]|nr:hypothetical protein [uncultured Caulobacter sp.]
MASIGLLAPRWRGSR